MKTIFTFCLLLVVTIGLQAQNTIIVQDGNNSTQYTDIDAAILNAPTGSHVYLSGGTFTSSNSSGIIINKEIHLVGVGHHPDSTAATGRTIIDAIIRLYDNSDSTSLEGFFMPDWNSNRIIIGSTASSVITNIRIENVAVREIDDYSSSVTINNLIVKNSIIGFLTLPKVNNILISNNIIDKRIYSLDASGTGVIENCVFTQENGSSNYYLLLSGYLIRDNFFGTESTILYSGVNNYFYNNISAIAIFFMNNNNIYQGNLGGGTYASVFVNAAIGDFNYSYDYHLKTGSSAIGGGFYGGDIGIYGGNNPYKEGAVPQTPHIQFKNINSTTNSDGTLPVHIRVKAQDN